LAENDKAGTALGLIRATSRAMLLIVRTMQHGDTTLFAAGRDVDRVGRAGENRKFAGKSRRSRSPARSLPRKLVSAARPTSWRRSPAPAACVFAHDHPDAWNGGINVMFEFASGASASAAPPSATPPGIDLKSRRPPFQSLATPLPPAPTARPISCALPNRASTEKMHR
jgi:hypothetical protein